MTLTHTLQLGFGTNQGSRYTITLPGADPFVDENEIIDAMQAAIDAKVIMTTNGTLINRQTAKLINTERVEIPVA